MNKMNKNRRGGQKNSCRSQETSSGGTVASYDRNADKLIHEYFGVNVKWVWETVRDDLPPLIGMIETMLAEDFHRVPCASV